MQPPKEILKHWSEVCGAATEGEWFASDGILWIEGQCQGVGTYWRQTEGSTEPTPEPIPIVEQTQEQIGQLSPEDCKFAALSRTALPLAIAAIEYLLEHVAHSSTEPVWQENTNEDVTRILNGETK